LKKILKVFKISGNSLLKSKGKNFQRYKILHYIKHFWFYNREVVGQQKEQENKEELKLKWIPIK